MKRLLLSSLLLLTSTSAFAWATDPAPSPTPSAQVVNNGGGGGAGGKATASARVNASLRQGQGQVANGGNVVLNGNLGGGSGGGGTRAPDISLPSFGGGGMDCPTVGFGAAGSGLGGGGGFGPSWISKDCNDRKVTVLILQLYGIEAARAFAEQNILGVSKAVEATRQVPPPVVPALKQRAKPDWCLTSSGRELTNHKECQ